MCCGRNFWKVLKIPALEMTTGARTSISSWPLSTVTPNARHIFTMLTSMSNSYPSKAEKKKEERKNKGWRRQQEPFLLSLRHTVRFVIRVGECAHFISATMLLLCLHKRVYEWGLSRSNCWKTAASETCFCFKCAHLHARGLTAGLSLLIEQDTLHRGPDQHCTACLIYHRYDVKGDLTGAPRG